jgi:hypothetical protein
MKTTASIISTVIIAAVTTFNANAANVTIVDGNQLFTDIGGDIDTSGYSAVGGFAGDASNQGQVLDLLSTRRSSATNTVSVADIYDMLVQGGLSSTGALVLGFSANESGNNNSVSITQLDIELERADGSSQFFTLGQDSITISDFNSGNSTAEAQLQLDLGFDFLQEYTSTSNRDLIIQAQLSGNTGGQDRLFLSSAFTANPLITPSFQQQSAVPLPASSWLFISALAGLVCHKRRIT